MWSHNDYLLSQGRLYLQVDFPLRLRGTFDEATEQEHIEKNLFHHYAIVLFEALLSWHGQHAVADKREENRTHVKMSAL